MRAREALLRPARRLAPRGERREARRAGGALGGGRAAGGGGDRRRYAAGAPAAARGASGGLWDWNLRTDELYYSPRWKTMLGYEEDEIEPTLHAWLELVHDEDRARVDRRLREHLAGKTALFEDTYRIRAKSGEYRWMLCRGLAIRDASRGPLRVAGSQTDVTPARNTFCAFQTARIARYSIGV